MWSDRTPPQRLRELAAALQAAVPSASERLGTTPAFVSFTNREFRNALATATYCGGICTVTAPRGTVRLHAKGFEILEAMLTGWKEIPRATLAGYLSYDLAAELEELGPKPPPTFRFPQFWLGLFDSSAERPSGADAASLPPASAIISRPDRAAFEASVARIVSSIHAGDIFQTNLCRSIETRLNPAASWDLFQRMRSINPARYEAFIRLDAERSVFSISPELFLRSDGGIVESSPIKGTRPRGQTAEEDRALAADLLASEKDRAELAMIVDVARNDLSRVCKAGSVQVTAHADLMTLPMVHHSFSTVRGTLRDDMGIADLLRAAFPAASISGAPKIQAMRIAAREENQPRGPCMGAIGWIGMDGAMELSVAIRTAFVADGVVRYYAGCGITAGSDPAAEFEESRHKAAAFVRALGCEDDPGW